MMYFEPERWDPLDECAIDWCRDNGLGGILQFVNDELCHAWQLFFSMHLDKLTADELEGSLAYQMVWSLRDHAFGAYNALLIAAHDANRGDVHSAIFSWGHYSLFR